MRARLFPQKQRIEEKIRATDANGRERRHRRTLRAGVSSGQSRTLADTLSIVSLRYAAVALALAAQLATLRR